MNFQNIRTFIAKNNELSIKNGIIRFMISNIVFVSLISIVSFVVFYNEAFEKQKLDIVKEQINLIYVNSESSRMSSDFKEVSKAIYKLSQVDEVFILDKDCNNIESIGLSFNGHCNHNHLARNWIFLKYDNTFSKIAYIAVKVKESEYFGIDKKIIFALLFFLLVILVMTVVSYNFFEKHIKYPLDKFKTIIPQIKNKDFSIAKFSDYPIEINPLVEVLSSTHKELEDVKSKLASDVEIQTKLEIASQVAHDIRSPLAVFDMIMQDLDEVSEEKKNLMILAHNRIEKISQDLLSSCKKESHYTYDFKDTISNIISEKEIEYKDLNFAIKSKFNDDDYSLTTKIKKSDLERIISNLINNSIEAFDKNFGEIIIEMIKGNDFIKITLEDNGKGIPDHVLSRLGEKGLTYGKTHTKSGNGLGIYHSKKVIESINGRFEVTSTINIGTKVSLYIPIS